MEQTIELIDAIARLVAAVAWPFVFFIFAVFLRREIKTLFTLMPSMLGRVNSVKFGFLEAELNRLAEQSAAEGPLSGEITVDQASVSSRIKARAEAIGDVEIFSQLDRLTIEYDTIRRAVVAGPDRTRQLTKIVVQMRALSQSASERIGEYKDSVSAGRRLAAIVMMQMQPDIADISWLEHRFGSERPFVFYHAALALKNVAMAGNQMRSDQAASAAGRALDEVISFGENADRETMEVLRAIISHTSPSS